MNKKGWVIRAIRFALVIMFLTCIFAPGGSPLTTATARAEADQLEGKGLLSENSILSPNSDNQEPPPPEPEQTNDYFSSQTVTGADGKKMDVYIIGGPPKPPSGNDWERQPVQLSGSSAAMGAKMLEVPAYNWVFGCSATSGAMIAAYYDRNGFPNMYTGPTNGGVMPMNNSVWPTWTDGTWDEYGNNPLAASHQGVDGRSTRGSIDDYWVAYGSTAQDPFKNNWPEHAWGDAIGDYMKTSQSAYGNPDGSTVFYTWTDNASPLTCDQLEAEGIVNDGTVGRKQFYQARGYTVGDCYNQKTDNNNGGFTLAKYRAEIDAGRPVMLNLQGHTVVGVGYDETSNIIYIHDTWDFNTYPMTWGGSYEGMPLLSVSIVNLATPCLPPTVPSLTAPADGATISVDKPSFSWGTSANASHYELQIDDNADFSSPIVSANNLNSLSYSTGQVLTSGTYYWLVRGHNTNESCNVPGSWSPVRSFTVQVNDPPPGVFNKIAPINGAVEQPTSVTLSWGASAGASKYEYCYDTTNDNACSDWKDNGTATSKKLSGLKTSTTYYWHVRATNASGIIYANSSNTAWSFTTRSKEFVHLPIVSHIPPPKPYSGTVTNNGTPLAGVILKMAYSTDGGSNWNTSYALATSDSQGVFTFPNTPEVGNGKMFAVYYDNPSSDPNYLWYFECNMIDSTGDPYSCAINLRDVVMKSPAKSASVAPPVTFTWTPRATNTDSYDWYFIDYDNRQYYHRDNLGYVSSLKMNFCNFITYTWYYWRIDVTTPYGFGMGYEDRPVRFTSMQSCSSGLENVMNAMRPDAMSLEKSEGGQSKGSSLLNWLLAEGQLTQPWEK